MENPIISELITTSLVLIPTSLDETQIFPKALSELILGYNEKNISYKILVESEKNSRRRWLKSGLLRDKISQFIEYNEQTQIEKNSAIIKEMQAGEKFLLMSDEGLPTFFDPGQKLVALMHRHQLKVGCLDFPCSPILALILSGFNSGQFRMAGFPPVKTEERMDFFSKFVVTQETSILMDTAYRLKLTLEQLQSAEKPHLKNQYFIGLDLARPGQEYLLGTVDKLLKSIDFERKRDFILIKAEK